MNIRTLLLVAALAGSIGVTGCRRQPARESVPPLKISIDAALGPVPAAIPDDGRRGERPLAAIRDEAGVVSEFTANEVVIVPRSQSELDDFVSRYKGRILGDNRVPPPPAQLRKTLEASTTAATEYVVRVDPSGVDYANLSSVAGAAGLGGSHVVSTELGARLLAVTVRETARGLSVSPNFVLRPQAVLRSTRERAAGASFDDGFNKTQFPRFQSAGSRANVTAAWTWVAAHGVARRIQVAVIDGGFWLNASGQPLVGPDGIDFPATPVQYNFVNDTAFAGGMNPAACSGGSPCPWHGNGSAGVAAGIVNNGAVAAGPGGSVADPWLFQTDIRDKVQRDRAVRTAAAWGADVISMSFSGKCNYWCRWVERLLKTDRGYEDALARGMVLVASAGNDTNEVGEDNFYHPCITDGVICVGALNDDVDTAAGYSNYGGGVDIWAPSDVNALTAGGATPIFAPHTGTSASAPFVAGIAAMLKAINPALTSDQVRDLLRDTAWADSSDSKVSRRVNALEAVRRASNDVLPPDRFEANESATAAKPIGFGQNDDLTLHSATDRDFYRLSVSGPANVTLTNTYSDDIGKPYLNFSKTNDCGGAVQLSRPSQPNQTMYTYGVTAGEYVVQLSSGRALPYDLGITSTGTSIGRDAFEGLPNNDVAGRAFSLGNGGGSPRPATIFPAGDVDMYRVDSTGSIVHPKVGGRKFTFAILATDMPVTVELLDATQTVVQTQTTSTDCKSLPALALPAGTFFVRVRGASAGSYTFAVGERHDSGVLYDIRAVWRLLMNPGGPVEVVVRGPEERYVFERGQDRAIGIQVIGEGLRATLLDSAGSIVAEGRSETHDGQTRQLLPLEGAVAGEPYVIKLSRDIGVAPAQGMRSPRVNGRLMLVSR